MGAPRRAPADGRGHPQARPRPRRRSVRRSLRRPRVRAAAVLARRHPGDATRADRAWKRAARGASSRSTTAAAARRRRCGFPSSGRSSSPTRSPRRGGELLVWGTPWHEKRVLPALRELLELPFEHVIVSHGDPVHTARRSSARSRSVPTRAGSRRDVSGRCCVLRERGTKERGALGRRRGRSLSAARRRRGAKSAQFARLFARALTARSRGGLSDVPHGCAETAHPPDALRGCCETRAACRESRAGGATSVAYRQQPPPPGDPLSLPGPAASYRRRGGGGINHLT